MRFDDEDNSDNYQVPEGFALKQEPEDAHTCPHGRRAWKGNECTLCDLDSEVGEDGETVGIVMGRPVDPNQIEILISNKMGIDFSDPYDDSVKMTCKRCMREVWIGPMQREKMAEIPSIVMCPQHAVESMHELGMTEKDVVALGHEHERGN